MKKILLLFPIIILLACSGPANEDVQLKNAAPDLVEGSWRLEFKLAEDIIAPVNLNVIKGDSTYQIEFINAEEKLIREISIDNGKITILDPIFNSWFEGKIIDPTRFEGKWYKDSKKYKIPFTATHGDIPRFDKPENLTESVANISGKWEVDFSQHNPDDHYKAIGSFVQVDDYVTGTFMTETGDYRFLEGNIYNDELSLSCFDGSHLFLFKGRLSNDSLLGTFWSGTHWEEPWSATRNETFELTNPDSLTYLKEGYDQLAFTFPNIYEEEVSLSDEKYQGKVVIVNIMGPWCPNCKDETSYLTELYNNNHEKGLEIIALSFDKSEEFEESRKNIVKIKDYFGAKYDFLIAGQANKIAAAKSLPMLNHIMSYPTTIFMDRQGNIRKIRTGFYGPGTGEYYTRYIEKTNDFVAKLLAEEVKD
jgi:thiol-disulfide isomerase/thioredoxin